MLRRCAMPVALAAACLLVAAAPAGAATPNDPLFRFQWNLRAIEIPAAWDVTRGAGATVAILDTGVAYEDRGRYRRAPDLPAARFVPGWDFVDGDAHPNDVPPRAGRRSHGTQMAAIVAQAAGNALGAAGVAPAASIMPVRVLEPDLTGSPGVIARGIRFAADHGADVINLSITGPWRSRALSEAVAHAVARGATVVAATGNEGIGTVRWPAADARVIAVGAVAQNLARAPYSNYGAQLDLVAPGGVGQRLDTGYGPSDGVVGQTLIGDPQTFCFCFTASTSAAAAQVAGVAALVVAAGRARGAAAVREALQSSARDLGPRGRDDAYGAGLVQASAALGGAPQAGESGDDGGPRWLLLAAGAALLALTFLYLLAHRRR